MGRGPASGTTRLEGGGIALPTRTSVDRREMGPAAAVWTALALTTLDRWLPDASAEGIRHAPPVRTDGGARLDAVGGPALGTLAIRDRRTLLCLLPPRGHVPSSAAGVTGCP